jgi:predicted aconitase with swiveling domain
MSWWEILLLSVAAGEAVAAYRIVQWTRTLRRAQATIAASAEEIVAKGEVLQAAAVAVQAQAQKNLADAERVLGLEAAASRREPRDLH